MSVSFNGFKIIPAPLVNINKTYRKSADGSTDGVLYNITLNGTILPWKGSPSGNYSDINDAFWNLGGYPPDESVDSTNGASFDRILRKQEALRYLFKDDGKSLEWQPAGGQPVVKCNPRILEINFPEGIWADRSEYSITCEADWIMFTNAPSGEDAPSLEASLIQTASEDWSFEEIDGFQGNAFTVTHNVSAQGILGYDENANLLGPAWQNAKNWVDNRTSGTIDEIIGSGIFGSTNFINGSYRKSSSVDEKNGSYSVTESWILGSGTTYTEESFSYTKSVVDDTFTVRYEGTIHGLSDNERLGGNDAIVNAKAMVPTNSQAKTTTENALGSLLEGNVLASTPTTKSVSINNQNGIVTFSFEWGADEDATFGKSCEATLDLDGQTNIYTLRLTCDIEGHGDTPEDRLNNAKSAIPTDEEAFILADNLVGGSLPDSVIISTIPRSKSSSFNEKSGTVRVSYTWNSTNLTDPEITIQTTFPHEIAVVLQVPGSGPIIQDMDASTEERISVSLSSDNNESKPNNATIISIMNDAAGFQASWILDSDQDNYNQQTGKYTRTRTFIVR